MYGSCFVTTRRRRLGLLACFIGLLFGAAVLSADWDTYDTQPHQSRREIQENNRNRINANKLHLKSNFQHSREVLIEGEEEEPNTRDSIHHDFPKDHAVDIDVESKPKTRVKATKANKSRKKSKKNKPVTTNSIKMAAKNDDRFDAHRVLELFSSCRKPDDTILIDCYINAYQELCKLFKAFGSVFTFVTSDVVEKIEILRDYRKSEDAQSYETVQSLLSHEVAQGTTNNKKKASGSRTLLRLHRALEFLEELLIKIRDTDNKDKFSTVASKAYDDTLAKHHAWLVKKAVHMAMYVLPTRPDLLKKMQVEDTESGMLALSKLIDELKIIYKITQDLYAKDKLLDLP